MANEADISQNTKTQITELKEKRLNRREKGKPREKGK